MRSGYGELTQFASDWLWETDEDHRLVYLSDRADALTGMTTRSGVGHPRWEVAANATDVEFWREHRADHEARRPFKNFIFPRLGDRGEVRWLKISGQPRFSADGRFLGYSGVGTDITDERGRQEALSRALADKERVNRHLELALAHMANGLLVVGSDGIITVLNRRFLELFDLDAEAAASGDTAVALLRRMTRRLPPAHAAALVSIIRQVPGHAGSIEHCLATRSGRHLRLSVAPAPEGSLIVTSEDITDQVRTAISLHEQSQRFHNAIESLPNGLCMFDENEQLIVINSQYYDLYGITREEVQPGITFRDILTVGVGRGVHGTRTVDQIYRERMDMVRGELPPKVHQRLADGRTIEVTLRPVQAGAWTIVYEDITAQVAAEDRLQEQNRLFNAALENMDYGVCMFDDDMQVLVVNQRYIEMYGLSGDIVKPGVTMREIMEHSVALGNHGGTTAADLYASYRDVLRQNQSAVVLRELSDGRTIEITHNPIQGGGWLVTYEDITQRRRDEARIVHLARHDVVTNLPNRLLLNERLAEALERSSVTGEGFAVCFLDLDRFKAVNDTFGHAAGDLLLKSVAERLLLKADRHDTVARLGGDEFAVIRRGDDRAALERWAAQLIEVISAPYEICDHSVSIGTSIGIALAPIHGREIGALLKRADLALYEAKSRGRGVYSIFEPGMDAAAIDRATLETDLKSALRNDELELWYQPQVDVQSGRLAGFEALLRWRHPTRGLVSPVRFVPIAEENGSIIPIGEWVLRRACDEAARWPSHLRVAVNISAAQLLHSNFELAVVQALASTGLSPTRLELEITESVLIGDAAGTIATLRRLMDIGIRISLDDFGTGYSSLSYLRAFPFDRIKIDRSFVQGLADCPENRAIVEAVVALGEKLGMTTTAEGIETAEQLAIVRDCGCAEAQGYLFSAPLTTAAAGDYAWADEAHRQPTSRRATA